MSKNITVAEECNTTMDAIEAYMEKRGVFTMLDSVMESGKNAAKIVDNMLSFSRKDEGRFTKQDLAKLLDKTVEIAEKDYDLKKKYDFRQIEIVREYDSSMPQVMCEGSKIQQVFLNILKNGAHAMSEGRVHSTEGGEQEKLRFILRLMSEGGMARIEIEDNGPGMDEAIRKRIFEPFFTTKSAGVGTGLGLSVSYFIITEDHGGTIAVESEPGKGAKFTIHLPIERKVH